MNLAAALVGGARARGRRLARAGTCRSARPGAIGDQTIWPMPSFSHVGTTSASMTRQSMVYCGWLETIRSKPISSAISQRGRDLLGAPLGHADVEHLALAHQVVEGAQRLLERRLVVVAVRLVQVDVVGLQPPQRGVADSMMCLRDRPRSFAPGAGRPVDLGEDLEALAPLRRAGPGRAPSRPWCRRRRRRCRRW